MKTKLICLLSTAIFAAVCMAAVSTSREAKPFPPPNTEDEIAHDPNWKILPKEDVYEVGHSKMNWSSIRDLPASGFRKLSTAQAKAYTGAYYSCPADKTPYLMTAVFPTKGGPGQFRAERNGDSVTIVFGGMPILISSATNYEQSAVVVNLDFTPFLVYTAVSSFQ